MAFFEQWQMFDRFGGAPPSFVMHEGDDRFVERRYDGNGRSWYFLNENGRHEYERLNNGPHPQGWVESEDYPSPT